jgi:hypothetical protein
MATKKPAKPRVKPSRKPSKPAKKRAAASKQRAKPSKKRAAAPAKRKPARQAKKTKPVKTAARKTRPLKAARRPARLSPPPAAPVCPAEVAGLERPVDAAAVDLTRLLERYRGGEHDAVWDELRRLGPMASTSPQLAYAEAVAVETMARVRTNLERIVERLKSSGYRFIYPALTAPAARVDEEIAKIEESIGVLPLSVKAFYRAVGSISLMGTHPDWKLSGYLFDDEHGGLKTAVGQVIYTDPLVVYPLDAKYTIAEHTDWKEWAEQGDRFRVTIAPDVYHKANVSGGGPYGVFIPDARADGEIDLDGRDTFFVDYLRDCLRWGGFPGLAAERDQSDPAILEFARRLAADLVSF